MEEKESRKTKKSVLQKKIHTEMIKQTKKKYQVVDTVGHGTQSVVRTLPVLQSNNAIV